MKEVILSIITVTKNPKELILDTIETIGKFISDEVEYIVVDGKSDQEILNKIVTHLPQNTKIISEPDSGIYEAMNKAWDLASGKYLLFINEGDYLLHIPLIFLRNSDADVIIGSVKLSEDTIFQGKKTASIKYRNFWPHQGTFYKRNIPIRYNTKYKIFGDFDLNQQLFVNNYTIEQIPDCEPIALHTMGGISNMKSGLKEFYQIIRSNFGITSIALAFLWFKLEGFRNKLFFKS
jgi:glycosyltransferase involved in cell wall biosynthesis